jgi:uncharacterized protein YraI
MNRSKVILVFILLVFLGTLLSNSVTASEREQVVQFTAPVLVVNASFLNVRTGPAVGYPVLITVVGGTELPVLAVASDFVWYQVSTIAGTGWVNVEFTLPRGDFTNVPVIQLSDIIDPSIATLPAVVTVTPGAVVAVAGGSTTTTGGIPCTLTSATLNTNSSNLYLQADYNSVVIGVLFFQSSTADYPVVGGSGQFVQLVVPGIGTGFVDSAHVILHPSGATNMTVVVLTGDAFVTSPPFSPSNPLFVPAGTEAFVVGSVGRTLELQFVDGNRAFVDQSITRVRTELASDAQTDCVPGTTVGGTTTTTTNATPGAVTVIEPDVTDGPHVVINTGFLNIRSGPGSEYSVVITLPGGTTLRVIGIASDGVWFLVSGGFGQGWVNAEFVLFRGSIDIVPVIDLTTFNAGTLAQPVIVVASSVVLYAAPGVNFGTIGTLVGPIEVPIVARTADNTWLQVSTTLGFGWVLSTQVSVRGDLTLVPVVS